MTAAVIFWAICIVVALIVLWLYIPDVIRRRELRVMLGGDLAANRAEIDRRFRQLGRKTARDYADQAKFERITGRSGRDALTAALAARRDTADAEYIRDNVIGYFDDDTYIMQMVQHINIAGAGAGGDTATAAIVMPPGPVTVDVTESALDRAANYRPDAQNSHDSAVNRGIRDGLARIRADVDIGAELASIRGYVAGAGQKYGPAMTTLTKMASTTEPVGTYGMREDAILATVWARARHPRNSANADNIRDAVIDALADAATVPVGYHDGTVCANGRVSRVFGALAGLDFDPAVSTLGDMGMWRNQIFNEVKDVIAATAARESGSADPEIAAAARFYLGDGDDCDKTDKFDAILKKAIHDTVYKYVDDIGGPAAATIIKECSIYAGVEV